MQARDVVTDEALQSRGVGRTHLSADIGHPRLDGLDYVEMIRGYLGQCTQHLREGTGLVLCGPFGSGKTSLAVCVMRESFAIGADVHMVLAQDLPQIMIEKPLWEGDTLDLRIRKVPLLVIDNLNDDLVGSKWKSQSFEALIRTRWNEMRSTIITTNLPTTELGNVVSSGCIELIRDRCYPITVAGLQWRAIRDPNALKGRCES